MHNMAEKKIVFQVFHESLRSFIIAGHRKPCCAIMFLQRLSRLETEYDADS
jgi:hypothetical protein